MTVLSVSLREPRPNADVRVDSRLGTYRFIMRDGQIISQWLVGPAVAHPADNRCQVGDVVRHTTLGIGEVIKTNGWWLDIVFESEPSSVKNLVEREITPIKWTSKP